MGTSQDSVQVATEIFQALDTERYTTRRTPAPSSVCWVLCLAGFVAWWPLPAVGQPANLAACPGDAYCRDAIVGGLIHLDCPRRYTLFVGRMAWYPLRCVGPITVGVNALATFSDRFPLYVEIVPMDGRPSGACPTAYPGKVVMVARGSLNCDYWEYIDIDITQFVPLGSNYALQLTAFDTSGEIEGSPGLGCVSVVSHPVSAVVPSSWGQVKALFR